MTNAMTEIPTSGVTLPGVEWRIERGETMILGADGGRRGKVEGMRRRDVIEGERRRSSALMIEE